MTINQNKLQEQNIVLQKWKENNFIGTYTGFTGVGKTRIGTIAACEFIKRNPNETSVIIVPTENLRDSEWENSFIKWDYKEQRKNVKIICIQSAYKLKNQYFDTVVVDEVHTALSSKYGDFLKCNKYKRLLCLTATPPEDMDKLNLLTTLAPVIWETSRERAIQLKLVSKSLVFNLGVSLTDEENLLYKQINDAYLKHEEFLGGPYKAYNVSRSFLNFKTKCYNIKDLLIFTPENRIIHKNEITHKKENLYRDLNVSDVEQLRLKINHSLLFLNCMRKRRSLLLNASNKILTTKAICNRYTDRKTIIFSESIAMADKIAESIGKTCKTYHSKLKNEKRKEILFDFAKNDFNFRHLSSVKALNAGFDIPTCDLGIVTGGNSKKLDSLQRNGRISRYIENKTSYFINLYCKNTQELKWVTNNSKNMEPKWIDSVEELPIN